MTGTTSWNPTTLKYVSLCALTIQQSVAILSVRYSRARSGNISIASTVVLLTEVYKLVGSLVIVYITETDRGSFFKTLTYRLFENPGNMFQVGLAALTYLLQNNLIFIAANHLDAPTLQVIYQLKIFTTAVFSVIVLKRRLTFVKWISLTILVIGIAIVEFTKSQEAPGLIGSGKKRTLLGFIAIIGAATCSGIGSVLFENILKNSNVSIWIRNIQLALMSVIFGTVSYCSGLDAEEIRNKGFFYGYDYFTVYLIMLQGSGGLIVAMVTKYADNILKGFAFCMSIICSCLFSILFFKLQLTSGFFIGSALVFVATFLYSY